MLENNVDNKAQIIQSIDFKNEYVFPTSAFQLRCQAIICAFCVSLSYSTLWIDSDLNSQQCWQCVAGVAKTFI
jgi:hypothetical protein